MKLKLFLILAITWTTNGFGVCYCLCSAFKTSGGERKICVSQPTILLRGQKSPACKDWLFEVNRATDEASCKEMGEQENNCHGYFQDASKGNKWIDAFDGRYHSCQWR